MLIRKTILAIGGAALCTALLGCPTGAGLINPQFVESLTGAGAVDLPGDAPALRVGVENQTSFVVQAQLSYRSANDTVEQVVFVLPPGDSISEVLICSVDEVTLGDVGDLDAVGAQVILGAGRVTENNVPVDPFIDVEAFGRLLREGANYNCGDSVNFVVAPSSLTRSGFQVTAFIRRFETN